MEILGSTSLFWLSILLGVKLIALFYVRKKGSEWPYGSKLLFFIALIVVTIIFLWELIDALLEG